MKIHSHQPVHGTSCLQVVLPILANGATGVLRAETATDRLYLDLREGFVISAWRRGSPGPSTDPVQVVDAILNATTAWSWEPRERVSGTGRSLFGVMLEVAEFRNAQEAA